MARIKIRSLTLCTLLLALSWTPVTQASQQTRTTELTQNSSSSTAKKSKEKNRQHNSKTTPPKKQQRQASTSTNKTRSINKSKPVTKTTKQSRTVNKKTTAKVTSAAKLKTVVRSDKCVNKKGQKTVCASKPKQTKNLTLAQAHKVRVQKAQKTAMTKLMGQLGKPYRWGILSDDRF